MIDFFIYFFSAIAIFLLVAGYLLLISVFHDSDRKDNDKDGTDNR